MDQILCDTLTALEFDKIAKQLVSQPALKLRWAALNLRKTRRLKPLEEAEAAANREAVNLITAGPIRTLKLKELPAIEGVYSFYDTSRPLFAGETENLQRRMKLHLDGKLPDWLNMENDYEFILKYAPVPSASMKWRDLWLRDFINQQRPLLNFQKVS